MIAADSADKAEKKASGFHAGRAMDETGKFMTLFLKEASACLPASRIQQKVLQAFRNE
jgi:hypothetical protein